jgi:hypothetical protein
MVSISVGFVESVKRSREDRQMPKFELDPKINLGHLLMAAGFICAGFGLYYNTQAKIAAEATARSMADAAFERDIGDLQRNRDTLAALVDRVNGKTDVNNLQLQTHMARTGDR